MPEEFRPTHGADEHEAPIVLDATPESEAPHILPPGTPKRRKAAAMFIFLTICLDILAMGMIAPVLVPLIKSFFHGNEVNTADWMGWFGTVWAVMQFVCSPIFGSLSDRVGRRPVVLLSNLGTGLDYMVMALAPSLPWLFLGRVISGVTSSSIPTAMSYAADVTPPEKRAQMFGMLSGAFGIGFVLGPAVGGMLGNINPRLPFWVAAGLSLLNFFYGLFVLPESLKPENRRSFSWRRANPVGSFHLLRSKPALFAFSIVLLLGYVAQQCLMNMYVLYTDFRYGWTPRTIGISLGVVGACSAAAGAGLVRPFLKWFGEHKTIFIGLVFGSLGYAIFGWSSHGTLFWFGIPTLCGMSLVWPTVQSIMSREVGPTQQGHLQGSINGLRGLSGVFGPGLFTWMFAAAIAAKHHPLPGLPFYVAAGMVAIAVPFALRAFTTERTQH